MVAVEDRGCGGGEIVQVELEISPRLPGHPGCSSAATDGEVKSMGTNPRGSTSD